MVTGLVPLLRRLGGVGAWELCLAWRRGEGVVTGFEHLTRAARVVEIVLICESCPPCRAATLCSDREGLRKE